MDRLKDGGMNQKMDDGWMIQVMAMATIIAVAACQHFC